MSLSGATVTNETLQDFQQLKMGNKYDFQFIAITKPDYKYIQTVLAEPKTPNLSSRDRWEKMRKLLKEDEPLFVVIPVQYEIQEGGKRGKLLFVSWVPEQCNLKDRMLSASCKVYLKQKLEGVNEEPIHATDVSELDYAEILANVSKGRALVPEL